jgi:hypothetical protein
MIGAKSPFELVAARISEGKGANCMNRSRAFIGALMCIAGLVLELGLFLKHRLWGGYPPDARLAVGLLLALLVNLYLLRGRRAVSK